jgi:Spy/CpxP family protein refolding chaperone
MNKTVKILSVVSIAAVILSASGLAMAKPGHNMRNTGPFGSGFMNPQDVGPFGGGGFMGMADAETMAAWWHKQLELTDEQETQLVPILASYLEKRQALVKEAWVQDDKDWDDLRDAHQELWQDVEKQASEVLTEEQMEQLDKAQDWRRGRFDTMKQRFADRRGSRARDQGPAPDAGRSGRRMPRRALEQAKGGPGMPFLEDLNLSSEQREQLFDIAMKYRETMRESVENFIDSRNELMNMVLNDDFDEARARQFYQQNTTAREDRQEDHFVQHLKMLAEMKSVLTPEQVEILQEKGANLMGPGPHGWR